MLRFAKPSSLVSQISQVQRSVPLRSLQSTRAAAPWGARHFSLDHDTLDFSRFAHADIRDSRGSLKRSREKGTNWEPGHTKIVATIGPCSEQMEMLQPLVTAGLRVMRLNFSHATVEEADLRIKNLRMTKGRHRSTEQHDGNLRAVLLDTQGPEIRTGKLAGDDSGKKKIQLTKGENIILSCDKALQDAGSTEAELFISYGGLVKSLLASPENKTVLLDDGAVSLTIETIDESTGLVHCVVDNTGELRSRAGVNLPGVKTDMPPMSNKDREDIMYGLRNKVDFVAASFIRNAAGVHEIREFMKQGVVELFGEDGKPGGRQSRIPQIISKIENLEAVYNYDEILEASDGIMVARGDLGVEIPIQQVTNAQKKMVAQANLAGKPVIVATQMLESMAKNPRPTRAEVSDVTNAVYDGADAVMLSGETAKGNYPIEALTMMSDIVCEAENWMQENPLLANVKYAREQFQLPVSVPHSFGSPAQIAEPGSAFDAVAKAAVTAAEACNASAIICITRGGTTARLLARQRPSMPILAFCTSSSVGRSLMLHRAIHPVISKEGLRSPERPAATIQAAKAMGFLKPGDRFSMVMREDNELGGSFLTVKIGSLDTENEE